MSTLNNAIKTYGVQGLILYLRIKTGRVEQLRIPGSRNTIRLRNVASDLKLFKQVMLNREYAFSSTLTPQFIIDAGANVGLSTLFFAMSYPGAKIVAIEPEYENFQMLCDNTRNYPNIKCIRAGLWHKSATLEVVNPGSETTGFMVSETSPDNPNGIKAISTGDILSSHNSGLIDLYKIDIEGAEKEVLSKNFEWLAKTKILIIELHDRKKAGCSRAFFEALRHYNFECHPFGQNLLLKNRDLI